MYNYFMLIGKIVGIVDLGKFPHMTLTLAIQREFREPDGTIGVDRIPIRVYDYLKDVVNDNLEIGDTVSVKGRILPEDCGTVSLVAERIMFTNGRI